MLERQHSSANLHQRGSKGHHRHSCLQRQKSNKNLLHRQLTLDCLKKKFAHCDIANNNSSSYNNSRSTSFVVSNDDNNNNNVDSALNRSFVTNFSNKCNINCTTTRGAAAEISPRVRHLLLKHSKFGFIKSFQDLQIGSVDSDLEFDVTESDELITWENITNFKYDTFISANIINTEDFELGRVLGAGGFGAVYLGTFKKKPCAIKVLHKYTKNPAAQIESFKAELLVMRFNHPNIVKTLAATHIDKFDSGAWIVMEYVGQKSLLGLLNDTSEDMDPDRRLKFSVQISGAIAYAHKNKVAHLDLKPANILITDDDHCKVGDFGCSQRVEFDSGIISPTNRSILTGTFAYRAPELLRGEPPTFKADLYSLGVTMWQMMARECPFSNMNQHVIVFGVVANGLRPTDPNRDETDPFELSYKDLYAQCWHPCPLNRPSAEELVEVLKIWKENL